MCEKIIKFYPTFNTILSYLIKMKIFRSQKWLQNYLKAYQEIHKYELKGGNNEEFVLYYFFFLFFSINKLS